MPISRLTPPLDYLQAASRASLQSFELTRLNHAANLRQEIAALIDQWIQETAQAMLARCVSDHHKPLQASAMSSTDLVRTLVASDATLFPDSQPPISEIVPAPPRFATPRGSINRKPQKQRQSATG